MKRIRLLAPASVLLLSGLAQQLVAQDSRLVRVDASVRSEVQALVDSAAALGLSGEAMIDVALLGARRGAAPRAVLQAVDSSLTLMIVARGALGADAAASEIKAGADVLRAGVDSSAVARLRAEASGRSLLVTLGVLADLVSAEVPAEAASRIVLGMTVARVADVDLEGFRRQVMADISLGAVPSAAAGTRAEVTIMRGSRPLDGLRAAAGGSTTGSVRIPPRRP